jgi:opacity protein-like surface antigen
MRSLLGSTLLFGTMAATSLAAQNAPGERQIAPTNYLEIAIMYDTLHASTSGGSNFWLQGGGVQAQGYFSHGLGVVADMAGEHTANMHGSGVGLDMMTVTIGPRYTWQPSRYRRYALYGQSLVGLANGFNSVFPGSGGATASDSGLALKVGGGVDYTLSRRIAVRVLEASWLRTQLPSATTDAQNNLHLGAGLILRFD